jgi:hypothetical protein
MVPITHRRTGVRRERSYGIKHTQNPGMLCLGKLMVRYAFLVDLAACRQKLRKSYNRVHILGWQITQNLSKSLFKGLFHHFSLRFILYYPRYFPALAGFDGLVFSPITPRL